jgi:hypothetical protein
LKFRFRAVLARIPSDIMLDEHWNSTSGFFHTVLFYQDVEEKNRAARTAVRVQHSRRKRGRHCLIFAVKYCSILTRAAV